MESIYEEMFAMMQMGNWSFHELYSLPIPLRKWFSNRLAKYFESDKDE